MNTVTVDGKTTGGYGVLDVLSHLEDHLRVFSNIYLSASGKSLPAPVIELVRMILSLADSKIEVKLLPGLHSGEVSLSELFPFFMGITVGQLPRNVVVTFPQNGLFCRNCCH